MQIRVGYFELGASAFKPICFTADFDGFGLGNRETS